MTETKRKIFDETVHQMYVGHSIYMNVRNQNVNLLNYLHIY